MEFFVKARAYGSYQYRIVQSLRSEIEEMIADLDCNLTGLRTDKRGHIGIKLDGEDSEFVCSVLQKQHGSVPAFDYLKPGFHTNGCLVDVGKVGYGLYVDIGITAPHQMDALIPLHRLREQLVLPKASLRTIAKKMILVDSLPVDIEILNADLTGQKIESKFQEAFLARVDSWIRDDHERLIVLGSTPDMIENVLNKSGHREDIYQIEQLGSFEFSLRCKRSTRASGILAAIGPRLKGVPMHLFIPSEIEAARK